MSELKAYLAENPKMIGALFTLLLLLSQASNTAAQSIGAVSSGP